MVHGDLIVIPEPETHRASILNYLLIGKDDCVVSNCVEYVERRGLKEDSSRFFSIKTKICMYILTMLQTIQGYFWSPHVIVVFCTYISAQVDDKKLRLHI